MGGAHKTAKKNIHRIGIKWKLFFIVIAFIICALIVIWFFQVRMLNLFYQRTKFNELEDSAKKISMSLVDERLAKEAAMYCSKQYEFDIWVLEISEESDGNHIARYVATVNDSGSMYFPFIKNKLETLYMQTYDNGGKYIAIIPAESITSGIGIEVIEDNLGNKDSYPDVLGYKNAMGTLYSCIETVGEKTYLVVQHANLTPLQAMVTTLKFQFFYIGVVMIIMSLLLVAIMSKLITKPIIKMNQAAKNLALGKYDADFSGGGYRESDELAEMLNFASCELARIDNLQKELISNVSHDLRTPLTMIKGYGEVMRDIPGENTPENIQVIIDETARLSDLVNDMLDLSKIQSGTRRPQLESFNITETVRETLGRYEKLIMKDGYKIEYSLDSDAVVVADRVMILQVIYNLINNAINYTGTDKYVLVKQTVTDTHVRICVTDTGEGISAMDMNNIWNRYYRVDKVHKRAVIGTGLGLSIVKGILEIHGASFGVDSVLGQGTAFWFELERAEISAVIDADYEKTEDGEI